MEGNAFSKGDSIVEKQNQMSSLRSKKVSFSFKQNTNMERSKQGTEKADEFYTSIVDQKNVIISDGDCIQNSVIKGVKKQFTEQNTITMKLSDIVKRVKLRQAASKLINSTRSRMQKNMKPHQYAFINDKAQDFTDLKKKPYQKSILSLQVSRDQKRIFINKGIQIFIKIVKMIPVINPASGWKYIWDIIICLSLIYSFFIIPTMVSFGISEGDIAHNNILDFLIIANVIDIFIFCNTGFYKRGVLCINRTSIWRKYQFEQMRIDFWSLCPIMLYRFLSLNLINYQNYFQFITLSILIKWKAIQKLYNNIQQKYILRPNVRNILKLMNLFFKILLIAHGCACLWISSGRISQVYYDENWFSYKKIQDFEWDRQYLSAFYFCIVTMTTVGYGDIVPQSPIELLVCIVILLFACGVFGFSVNTIQAILQDFSKAENEILDKMFIIKNYLFKKSINQTLSKDVTEYLEYYWRANQQSNSEEEEKMLKQLPDTLRNDLLIESNKIVLRDCSIFQNNFSEDVINATIPIIQERNFTPSEVIYTESDENIDRSIYFVQEGIVEIYIDITNQYNQGLHGNQRQYKTTKRLKKGDCFGEVEFFTDGNRTMNVRSINFSTLLKIERKDFINSIKKFPQDYEQFCYIKDRLTLQHDFSKINHKCMSCKGESHQLEACPYLHFIPNKPKLIALLSRSQRQHRNELPVEKQKERKRQRYRLLPLQIAQIVNTYLQMNEELVEEYNFNYLSYDISKCDVCTNLINLNPSNSQFVQMNSVVNPIQNQQSVYLKQRTNDIATQYNINPVFSNTSNYVRQGNSFGGQKPNNIQQYLQANHLSGISNQKNEDYQQKAKLYQYQRGISKGTVSIMDEADVQEVYSPKALKLQPIQMQRQKTPTIDLNNNNNNNNQSSLNNQNFQSIISPLNYLGGSNQLIRHQTNETEDKMEQQIMSPKNRYRQSFNNFNNQNSSINNNMNSNNNNINNNSNMQNNNQQNSNFQQRQDSINQHYKKLSILYTYNDIINIYKSQNSQQNFHIKRLFFDIFYGEFERMKQYEFYYPLNNYQFVIKQIRMDSEQRKKMKNKLLEQQRQNRNKIIQKKKKRNGPRGSINQLTGDHQAIKKLVDKYEQENREVKSMKGGGLQTANQTLLALNTNIYINNPNFSNNLSPQVYAKRGSQSNTPSNNIQVKSQNFFKSNNLDSDSEINDANNSKVGQNKSILSKIGNYPLNVSIAGSIADSQSSSDLFNIYSRNHSIPIQRQNVESLENQGSQNVSTKIQKSQPSQKNIKNKVQTELDKFLILESKLSPPQIERPALNYDHTEIPDITMHQYNSELEDVKKK